MNIGYGNGDSGELRVFVLSDDRGMRGVRDLLARKVFPSLRLLCRSRGVEFTAVDLRSGLKRTRAEHGRLLRLSLEELGRYQPYVIGLIGSSHGTIPDAAGIDSDPHFVAGHAGLAESLAAGESLLEMEIKLGVFANRGLPERSYFYFSDREPGEENPRLDALKQSIRTSGVRVREGFVDDETLAQRVHDDLLALLNRLIPEGIILSPLELERRSHEAFAASRRHVYVPKPHLVERIDRHVRSEDPPLLIHGEPGSGKSALVAYWTAQYRRAHPDRFVIAHHVGAVSTAGTSTELLRRITLEIRERVGGGDDIPAGREELAEQFPFWLAKASAAGLVLIVDGVSQLEDGGRMLEWLPEHIPPGVRLVISTTDVPVRAERERWPAVRLEPLSVNERIAISTTYLADRKAEIEPESVLSVAADASSSNPLFLRTRLEELRLFGAADRRGRNLEGYLSASTLDDLFIRLLERLEEEYGRHPLTDVLRGIWGARYGLSEPELERIVGCSRLELTELLAALDYHLLRNEGRLRFFHDALRRAVEHRYLDIDGGRVGIHEMLARHFKDEPDAARRAEELPWQLLEAGRMSELRESIADIDLLVPMIREDKEYELLGYWLAVGAGTDIAEAYRQAVERYEAGNPDRLDLARILGAVGDFLRHCGRFEEALPFVRRAAAIRAELLGRDNAETAQSLYNLANLLLTRGDLDEAEECLRAALAVQERTLGPEHSATAQTIGDLARVLEQRGEYDEAETLYRKALLMIERSPSARSNDLGSAINNLAGVLHMKGRYEDAESLYRRALSVWESAYGMDHPNTAIAMNNVATLLLDRGDNEGAEKLSQQVLDTWERTLGPDHPMVASVLCNWASVIARTDSLRAVVLMERALEIHERAYTEPNADTAIMVYSLGRIHYYSGDLVQAERYFRRAYDLQSVLLGEGHPDAAITMSGLAFVYRDRGEFSMAERLFRRSVEMLEKALGAMHPHVALQYMNIALSAHRRGDARTARENAIRALEIYDTNEESTRPRLAELYALLAEIDAAAASKAS